MSESRINRPPSLPKTLSLPLMTGSVFAFLVLMALPISQMVSGTPEDPPPAVDTDPYERPPDIQKKEEPPEPETDEKIDKPENDREKPPLDVIEMMNNPDLGRFASGTVTVNYDDFAPNPLDDGFCPWDELTRAPRAIRQQPPQYPSDLKHAGIEGEVILTFIVRADGTTEKIKVVRSTNPGFERPAVSSARKWVFEPGEKDGRIVSTNVRITIPFRINSGL